MTDKEILENCINKTIISIEVVSENDSTVSYCVFHFSDGTKLEVNPSSYNYGPQNLIISE